MSNIFGYEHIQIPDCKYKISPSQIGRFFEYPKQWYLENIKKEEPEFQGNTASFIGTICHYIYSSYVKGINPTREEINIELQDYLKEYPNKEVNFTEVTNVYPQVASAVMNNYVIKHNVDDISVETPISYKVKDGIYVAGTYDRLEDDILCDYKHVSSKPNEYVLPFGYRIQLLTYAYILRKMGKEVNKIRIIYGVKPTKTLNARCFTTTENVTDENLKLAEDTLNLIADSIITCEEHPELTYLIFKSMELKNEC